MTEVQTVRGPVDPARLGTTLMHEHVFVLTEELRQNYPGDWDEEARVADAAARLTVLRQRGIDTIADPTVLGLGRNLPRIMRVNAAADINIIVATGLYTYRDLPFPFQYQGPGALLGGDEPLVEMFTRDLTEGIAGTPVRAAFLKCAIDRPGLTPGVERVLQAVAQAHHRTGAPVMVHTDAATGSGRVVQQVLAAAGVDLSRVLLAHCGDSTDLGYLTELMDAGSLIGMDRFGLDLLLPLDQRADTVAELCRRGYAERMVLAHDASCYIDWFPPGAREALAPNWQYTHIPDEVLPALARRGVTEQQLHTMLTGNPRAYFTGAR